jgi:hypothetical protein
MILRPFAPRLAAPRCRGGASSLLRLSASAAGRWPSAKALTAWADRGADNGESTSAPMVAASPDAASQWFTRLWPSRT